LRDNQQDVSGVDLTDEDFESWARPVVEAAAERARGAIPSAQHPTVGSEGSARSVRRGYIARYVHFVHPEYQDKLALWLFAVPAGHPYNVSRSEANLGIGIKHDADTELDEVAWTLRLSPAGFRWRPHLDHQYAGFRIYLPADLKRAQGSQAEGLADRALRASRRAQLLAE
jgi:hypothetical protein